MKSVCLIGKYRVGDRHEVQVGEKITVQARVGYEGAEPCGILLHTNLGGKRDEMVMRRVAGDLYQGEVEAACEGGDFCLTVSVSTRRHDHCVKHKWAGWNVSFRVKGRG